MDKFIIGKFIFKKDFYFARLLSLKTFVILGFALYCIIPVTYRYIKSLNNFEIEISEDFLELDFLVFMMRYIKNRLLKMNYTPL